MKKTVSRIFKTTEQGARNLDFGLENCGKRTNIEATQYAVCPVDGGKQLVKVQVTIVILPYAQIDLHRWFTDSTDAWVRGWEDQASEPSDVIVSDA